MEPAKNNKQGNACSKNPRLYVRQYLVRKGGVLSPKMPKGQSFISKLKDVLYTSLMR